MSELAFPLGHSSGDRLAALIEKDQQALSLTPEAPRTFEEKVKAARQVVRDVRNGTKASTALPKAGFSPSYAGACNQCASGTGFILDKARKGESADAEPICTRSALAFVRLYLGLRPPCYWKDDPDNDKLRKELSVSKLSASEIAERADLHATTITKFMDGKSGLRADTRRRIRKAIQRKQHVKK